MVDFHLHSTFSDGLMLPDNVIRKAIDSGLAAVALTDHNYVSDYVGELRERYGTQIQIVNGIELSTEYVRSDGDKTEVHIVGVGFKDELLRPIVKRNRPDRRAYINAIRDKLDKECGISIPTYDEFKKLYPKSFHLGRTHIADYMLRHKITTTFDEGFDKYIGSYGQRRAYVNSLNYLNFIPLEEGVEAIKQAGGIPVLAHLFSYNFSSRENMRLIQIFREHAGADAALEVFYGRYSRGRQRVLRAIADEWGLLYSSGSDFHARTDTDQLMAPSHLDGIDPYKHVAGRLIARRQLRGWC